MPQPDVGDVHVNSLLTNVSVAYRNGLENFIADRVFPLVGVDKQSDIYPVYDRGNFFADEGTRMLRAPGTQAPTVGWKIDNTNLYFANNYALGVEIPDELRANADAVFNMDRDAVELLTDLQLIRRERSFAAKFMTTGVWGTDKTVDNKWSDYAGSDPFGDMEDGLDTVEAATGVRPNIIVMGAIVWRRLKHHPDFIDRIRGGATTTNPALFTPQMLANYLGVDRVLVGRALYRSSDENLTVTLARIMDDDLLMVYAPATASTLRVSGGYTFYWKPLNGNDIQFIRRGRHDRNRYDWIEAHSYYDQKLIDSLSGYFFPDVVD